MRQLDSSHDFQSPSPNASFPVAVTIERKPGRVADGGGIWYEPAAPQAVGIAAPVRTLLELVLDRQAAADLQIGAVL